MTAKLSPVIGGIDIRDVAGCSCLRLRRASRHATQAYDRALASIGLTITQLGLLGYLYGALVRSGGGLSIGILAEQVGMDPTTLNRNLKPLEVGGLIASGSDASDRRIRELNITEAGRAKLSEATPLWRMAQNEFERQVGLETTLALNGLLDLTAARIAA